MASLAEVEPLESLEEIRDKWLFVVLAWLHEHRDDSPDPLQTVEIVYAGFDYPPSIEVFVRYMPSDSLALGSREENEARLVQAWGQLLE